MGCTDNLVFQNPNLELHHIYRFPFDDDCGSDLDQRLDRLVEEHPEIAEPLRTWRQDQSAKKKRTDSSEFKQQEAEEKEKSEVPKERQREETRGLETKLRNTVPDMRREQEEELDRVGRSQSAPPSQQHGRSTDTQGGSQTREPVVRHIPIFVEGRDEPVIPKDFVDSPMPRGENRNRSRDASPIPPTRRPCPEQYVNIEPQNQPRPQHTSSVHINNSQRQTPVEVKINVNKTAPPEPQAQVPRPASGPAKVLGPLEKVQAVQEEVGSLKGRVESYNGASRQDKEYVYLDEMLTRNLLKLDNIETDGREDVRAARKEAIRQIQRCISYLENKAPQNSGQGITSAEPSASSFDTPLSSTDSTIASDLKTNQPIGDQETDPTKSMPS